MGSNLGILTAGTVSLDGASTYSVNLAGTTAGTGYSPLVAGGAVSLGGSTLGVNVGYTPAPGDQFTILKDNSGSAASNTFAGLDEGGVLTAGPGDSFQITY